jgi:hypothetical protein
MGRWKHHACHLLQDTFLLLLVILMQWLNCTIEEG